MNRPIQAIAVITLGMVFSMHMHGACRVGTLPYDSRPYDSTAAQQAFKALLVCGPTAAHHITEYCQLSEEKDTYKRIIESSTIEGIKGYSVWTTLPFRLIYGNLIESFGCFYYQEKTLNLTVYFSKDEDSWGTLSMPNDDSAPITTQRIRKTLNKNCVTCIRHIPLENEQKLCDVEISDVDPVLRVGQTITVSTYDLRAATTAYALAQESKKYQKILTKKGIGTCPNSDFWCR